MLTPDAPYMASLTAVPSSLEKALPSLRRLIYLRHVLVPEDLSLFLQVSAHIRLSASASQHEQGGVRLKLPEIFRPRLHVHLSAFALASLTGFGISRQIERLRTKCHCANIGVPRLSHPGIWNNLGTSDMASRWQIGLQRGIGLDRVWKDQERSC